MFLSKLRSWQTKGLLLPTDELKIDGQHSNAREDAKDGRRVAKLVARLLATAALWVRIQTSLKKTKKNGRHSKGVANTLQQI